MITLSAIDLTRFVLAMVAIGAICGIPIGHWLALQPVKDRRPPPPLADPDGLADHLEHVAEQLRAHHPSPSKEHRPR